MKWMEQKSWANELKSQNRLMMDPAVVAAVEVGDHEVVVHVAADEAAVAKDHIEHNIPLLLRTCLAVAIGPN